MADSAGGGADRRQGPVGGGHQLLRGGRRARRAVCDHRRPSRHRRDHGSWCPSTAWCPPRCSPPTATSTMPAGERWRPDTGSAPTSTPTTSSSPSTRARQIRMLFGPVTDDQAAAFRFPGRLRPAGRRRPVGARRARHRRDAHSRPHPWPLLLPSRRRGGAVHRGPALRRVDRPHRPPRRRSRHPGPARWPACSPSTTPPGSSPATGPETTVRRERLTNPFRHLWET